MTMLFREGSKTCSLSDCSLLLCCFYFSFCHIYILFLNSCVFHFLPPNRCPESSSFFFFLLNPSSLQVTSHSLVFIHFQIFCFKLIVLSSSSHYCPLLCLHLCTSLTSSSSPLFVLVQLILTDEKKRCFLA